MLIVTFWPMFAVVLALAAVAALALHTSGYDLSALLVGLAACCTLLASTSLPLFWGSAAVLAAGAALGLLHVSDQISAEEG